MPRGRVARTAVGAATLVAALGGCPRARAPSADACGAERFVVAGACVSRAQGSAYCGAGWRPDDFGARGRCTPVPCEPSAVVDQTTGACLPPLALRAIAERQGIVLAEGETLACPSSDLVLVVTDGAAQCLPAEAGCARGSRWAGSQCADDPFCPLRSAFDASRGACVRFALDDGSVDLARWSAVVLGPDGGDGSRALCAPLARDPRRAGLPGGGARLLRLAVDLDVPDNDMTAMSVHVRVFDEPAGNPMAGEPLALATAAASTLGDGLRALGGTSTSTHVATTLRCSVRTSARPVATRAAGDAGR